VKTTPGEVPIENLTSVETTEIPKIVPPTFENDNFSYKEYLIIFVVILLLVIIPFIIFRKSFIKGTTLTSSQEGVQA
jgi:hypothetical protein